MVSSIDLSMLESFNGSCFGHALLKVYQCAFIIVTKFLTNGTTHLSKVVKLAFKNELCGQKHLARRGKHGTRLV